MNAYDKDYLYYSQKNFSHMVDFAVNTCECDMDEFFNMFLVSNVCAQFATVVNLAQACECDANDLLEK